MPGAKNAHQKFALLTFKLPFDVNFLKHFKNCFRNKQLKQPGQRGRLALRDHTGFIIFAFNRPWIN